MKCEYCDNEVAEGLVRCPSCGAIMPHQSSEAAPRQQSMVIKQFDGLISGVQSQSLPQTYTQPVDLKSKWAFILLGIFLGAFGIHNFYLGYISRGVTKLLITILSLGWLGWAAWIWGIVEICTVRVDAKGCPLES